MVDTTTDNTNQAAANDSTPKAKGPEFSIQRIYLKDISLESPLAPLIFRQEWKPEIDLQINVDSTKLEDDFYQIVLKITVTAKNSDKVALLIEVQQAGIFLLRDFDAAQLTQMLGAFCPNIIFPYAREFISEAAIRAGFPPLYLAPINFDAIFAEQQRQKQTSSNTNATAANNPVSP